MQQTSVFYILVPHVLVLHHLFITKTFILVYDIMHVTSQHFKNITLTVATFNVVPADSLAHASERETVFSTVIQAGRVGIMTNLTLLMDDIGLLHPTILSTTPRYNLVRVLLFLAVLYVIYVEV